MLNNIYGVLETDKKLKYEVINTDFDLNQVIALKQEKIKPILKWSGGKTSELPIIFEHLPEKINNYFEPFIGGGAVWLAMNNIQGQMLVNDYSKDLINLYTAIKTQDNAFITFLNQFNQLWLSVSDFISENRFYLEEVYFKYRNDIISKKELEAQVKVMAFDPKLTFTFETDLLVRNYQKTVIDKFSRMKNMDSKKGLLDYSEYIKNIETAFKGALYMFIRDLYNQHIQDDTLFSKGQQAAIYFIVRDLCYSGMFRFNSKGLFNVPYGGNSYNSKSFTNKINHIRSKQVVNHFNQSIINQGDFYDFMKKYEPQEDDFIFLDPPYDTEFSAYDGNEFNLNDQKRLADYLINDCKGKWMVVIKYTDYIYSLYNKEGINITSFDKTYAVNFMERNNQEVIHILIKNY